MRVLFYLFHLAYRPISCRGYSRPTLNVMFRDHTHCHCGDVYHHHYLILFRVASINCLEVATHGLRLSRG